MISSGCGTWHVRHCLPSPVAQLSTVKRSAPSKTQRLFLFISTKLLLLIVLSTGTGARNPSGRDTEGGTGSIPAKINCRLLRADQVAPIELAPYEIVISHPVIDIDKGYASGAVYKGRINHAYFLRKSMRKFSSVKVCVSEISMGHKLYRCVTIRERNIMLTPGHHHHLL